MIRRTYTRTCTICGKKMVGVGAQRKYCDNCQRTQHRKHEAERRREAQRKKARERLQKMTLTEVVRAADAEGMSYGKWVQKHGG